MYATLVGVSTAVSMHTAGGYNINYIALLKVIQNISSMKVVLLLQQTEKHAEGNKTRIQK